jgi:hypothetical protein
MHEEEWPLMKFKKSILLLQVIETVKKAYTDIASDKTEAFSETKPTK